MNYVSGKNARYISKCNNYLQEKQARVNSNMLKPLITEKIREMCVINTIIQHYLEVSNQYNEIKNKT